MDFLCTKFDESWESPANLVEKMNDLERKLEGLNALKEDTMSRMSTELRPRKKLKKAVELWFKNVERIDCEIQELQQKIGESNVVVGGFLKGDVLKKTREVDELSQQINVHDSLVVDNPNWIGEALPTTTLFGGTTKICMEKIWTYLMDDDIQKIGVWGMGGVGKTTIIKLIHNKLLKETEKFNIVIWITVSREMNTIKLQNRIAREMNASLDEDEDEATRARKIHEMFSCKGKYVLILDDLWDNLSIEEVGIPEPSNGCKLLVTTRLLEVCRYLDCRLVKVHTLSKQDAWSLFLEKVGQDVLNHPNLLPIVKSVAKECAGLPLAIVIIASSMKGVLNVHEWRNALHELQRKVKSVNGVEDKVFQQLQFSYDRLQDNKLKYCFLHCALYPEDCMINTNELIKLWIAEGLVEEMDSMQLEIDKGHTILNKLKNSCLIDEGTINKGHVKLHDMVRDMAIRITSVRPRFLARASMQLKEIPNIQDWDEDLEKASLMDNWQLHIPSQMSPPKCRKLTTLLLSGCSIKSIPESFFEHMHALKILDLSYNFTLESLPNSISNLETLTTLLLRRCKSLEKAPSVSKLESLKMLDLGGTNIKDIPHGMERLVNLKYLDLSATRITGMEDEILAKFILLRHLAIDIFLTEKEVRGLRKLEFFQGRYYGLNNFVPPLPATMKRPTGYDIYVTDYEIKAYEIKCLYGGNQFAKRIKLHGCNILRDDIKLPSDVEELKIGNSFVHALDKEAFFSWFVPVPLNIFSSLSRIAICNCKCGKTLFLSNWVLQNLQNLKFLCVVGCNLLEEIIASESEGTSAMKISLPQLRRLELRDLIELENICGANGVMDCDSIEVIEITNCPRLRRIPLNLPLQDDGQPSPPPSLRQIRIFPAEWSRLQWDHPNAKYLLEPYTEAPMMRVPESFAWTATLRNELKARSYPEMFDVVSTNNFAKKHFSTSDSCCVM